MGPDEIINRLVQWVTANPESIVGYGLGVVTVVLLYWLVRRPLLRSIERLSTEVRELREAKAAAEVKYQSAKLESDSLRFSQRTLVDDVDQLKQANARLEVRLETASSECKALRASYEALAQENIELRDTRARLETRLDLKSQEAEQLRQDRQRLAEQNESLRQSRDKLEVEHDHARAEGMRLRKELAERGQQWEAWKEGKADLERQVRELSEQVDRLANFDGKVWEKAPACPVPEFRPLAERRVPIIAVANLKGGVGKTTLTANLGAILAKQKHRVLLVDLDYQGSLTSLCLGGGEIAEIRRTRRFVDQLLQRVPAERELLTECAHRVEQLEGVRLVAADEPLADVENQLMARWLIQPRQGDVRYLLRSYLHSAALSQEYDYVLIDCPPRHTTACINAFAAADYLLVPVLLDRTSAEAVPRQLRAIQNLKRVVCPDLALLGIVANCTRQRQGELISREKPIWEELPGTCDSQWGTPVYQFSAKIREHGAFAEAARNNTFAALHREVQPMFLDLASELKARIAKHEREGPPTVPAQPPAAS